MTYCWKCGVDREGDWLCVDCQPKSADATQGGFTTYLPQELLTAANARIAELEAEVKGWKEWHSRWIDDYRELRSLRAERDETPDERPMSSRGRA